MSNIDIKILEGYADFLRSMIVSLEKCGLTEYSDGSLSAYKVALRSFESQLEIIKIGQ